MMKIKWILVIIFLLASSYAAAQDFKNLTADELKQMIEQKEKVLIVDTRAEKDYLAGHIPTAVNITSEKFSKIQDFLPADKDSFLVFYCRQGAG